MKKNERDRTEKFLEAQTFTLAVMQSLMETATSTRMRDIASDAHQIAVQAISSVVDQHPNMAKVVDRIMKEIVVNNEQG